MKSPFRLHGGVHPGHFKEMTSGLATEDLPMSVLTAEPLRVSLHQNIGAPSKTVVAIGDHVLKGQLIANLGGFVGSVVHAPTSGTILAVEPHMGPAGRTVLHAVLEADGEDKPAPPMPPLDPETADRSVLDMRVRDGGIIGMGGAGFPSQVKINPPPGKTIDTLILNGAECEPYLTCDHRLMLEHAEEVWRGALLLRKMLGGVRIRIAIEDNKPDAILALAKFCGESRLDAGVVELPSAYPQGGEKQIIFCCTGREVPPGGLPADVGVVVSNVGTVFSIFQAVARGIPLFERITTVSGPAVVHPKNIRARIGLSYRSVIDFCGGLTPDVAKVLCGGPMMGFAQPSLSTSVGKATSGIVALREADVAAYSSDPCIGCGRCNAACTFRLLPSEMGLACEADDIEEAEALHVMDCCECGACAFVCPARRPLVQHFRRAKGAIVARKKAEQAAEAAKKAQQG